MITLDELKVERNRRKMERSLAEFVKGAWPILEPTTELCWNWHIDAICDHLEAVTNGDIKKLMINVPPGHMKSLLVAVFWPAWVWLRNPAWRVLFTTYADELSKRDSMNCRDIIESQWYRETFKVDWELSKDRNTKSFFSNTKRGARMALSVEGKATGFRGDAVVFDDPMNVENEPSKEALEKITNWWDQRMTSRLNDMDNGVFVGIMQRIHEGDLSGHLINKDGEKWEHLCLQSEFEPENVCETSIFKDPRKKRGELLFKGKFPRKVIEQAKIDLGPQFEAQHQQRPSAVGGQVFEMKWWRFWYHPDLPPPAPVVSTIDGVRYEHMQVPLPKINMQCQSWDLSFKKTSSSDFVCGQVWGTSFDGYYLLDQVHGRMSFTETVEEFEAMSEKWPYADDKFVEDKANGPALIDMLSDKISGIEAINPEGGKEARAHAATVPIKRGQVYLPHPLMCPWVNSLLSETRSFPKGKHDDQVDALTQALNKLRNDTITVLLSLTRE